jgi:hypothetical protein
MAPLYRGTGYTRSLLTSPKVAKNLNVVLSRVIDAVNVVLSRVIDAVNVVLKTR